MLGGIVAHFRTSRNERGDYLTAVQGDGEGFPDLIIITRFETLLVRELKSDTGVLRPAQKVWIARFQAAGVNAGVWRPRDLDLIRYELAH